MNLGFHFSAFSSVLAGREVNKKKVRWILPQNSREAQEFRVPSASEDESAEWS